MEQKKREIKLHIKDERQLNEATPSAFKSLGVGKNNIKSMQTAVLHSRIAPWNNGIEALDKAMLEANKVIYELDKLLLEKKVP